LQLFLACKYADAKLSLPHFNTILDVYLSPTAEAESMTLIYLLRSVTINFSFKTLFGGILVI